MVGYVAKDEDGSLFLYEEEPEWDDEHGMWMCINNIQITEQSLLDKFSYLTSDDEPVPVEIKLEIL